MTFSVRLSENVFRKTNFVKGTYSQRVRQQHSDVWRQRLYLYSVLTKLRRPKTFSGKIFFVAFVGTYIPLLMLLGYLVGTSTGTGVEKVKFLLFTFGVTLLGTAATLHMIRHLMAPITMTYSALRGYLEREEVPTLPTGFTDEAGVLMADATHVIGQLDRAVQRLTGFDPVTALPNRNTFLEAVHQEMELAGGKQSGIAVLVVDLTGLGEIQWGVNPEAAESALQVIALRLMHFSSSPTGLARVGEQTFAILVGNAKVAEVSAMRMLKVVNAPVALPSNELNVNPAIGIARWPGDAPKAEGILAAAESAAVAAHDQEGRRIALFNQAENEALLRRLWLETRLSEALERGELSLAYQPIVDVRLGYSYSAEALLRWKVDDKPISPGEFIPVAEMTGLIVPIGEWVLRTACVQAAEWQRLNRGSVRMSVNVAAAQLSDPNFTWKVSEVLRETGLAPKMLQIEVTESTLMTDVASVAEKLARLRELGVVIAVDDFGTGYSSLSSLRRLPIDVLKVDQAFVSCLPDDQDDVAVVKSVASLAMNLRMEVIAEGVETQAQAECLVAQGYRYMQGYFFGRPQDPGALSAGLLQGTAVIEVAEATSPSPSK